MRTILILLALSLTALSGCADSEPVQSDDEVFDELEGRASSTTGVIRGVVLDPTITPIAGVTVSLRNEDASVETNENGAFVFSDLPAGNYFLEASKIGYVTIQSSANVVAGEDKPPIIKIQMESNPSTLPFIIADQWEGFIECSLRVGTANQAGSVGLNACNGVGNQDVNHPIENFEEGPKYLQSELIWESTQAFGSDLSLVLGPPSCVDVKYARADGPSPLVIQMEEDALAAPSNGNGALGPDEGICLRVFTYTSNTFAHAYGMQLSQKFTKFTHTFYNMEPDEGWMFVEDGTHPIPE